nr:type II toxin-antitoxin system PemK/MazF family toxin [Oscillochloris trichoides]
MNNDIVTPRRGAIWLVNFNPTLGAEIKKIRPAVVVSSDAVGRLPIKLVAPLTDWKDRYTANLWHIRLDPDQANNLEKPSAVDVLQLRGMDLQRFVRPVGRVSAAMMEEIAAAIAAVVEYQ